MKLAFSTLACPGWSTEHALEQARGFGYDGVEWRLIDGAIADANLPSDACTTIRAAAERLGLSSVALGSSIQLAEARGADRDRVLAEGRTMLGLAAEMGAGWLRVFIGRIPDGTSEEQAVERVRDALAALLPDAERAGVGIALEVHPFEGRGKNVSGTSDSELCRRVAADLPSPRLGMLSGTSATRSRRANRWRRRGRTSAAGSPISTSRTSARTPAASSPRCRARG